MSRGDPSNPDWLHAKAMEPIAKQFKLNYYDSMVASPRTPATRTLAALSCGASVLMDFAYPETWEQGWDESPLSKRECRKAAKRVQIALRKSEGREAIARAAQGFGLAQAALWRRAADPSTKLGQETPEELRAELPFSARTSEALAEQAAQAIPIKDPHGVLPKIAAAEEYRLYDPDNPDAMTDLRGYADRSHVCAEAVALALGAKFGNYEEAVVHPLKHLLMVYSTTSLASWAVISEYWTNLLRAEPVAWLGVSIAVNEKCKA